MLEDVRKYVEAAFESMNQSRAREMARSMLQGQPSEQVNRVARELMGWSQRTRDRITELVQSEVKRQVKAVGIATRDDLDALRARVRELEKGSGRPSSRSSSTRQSTAKRSSAKKSTAKKSSAKRSSSSSSSGPQGSSG